jgi:peptidyl-prolyl cis-trans isomerase C
MVFAVALSAALMVLLRARAVTGDTPMMTNAPAVAAAATNSNPAAVMTALFGDPVIAKGKGVEIKESQLDEVVTGLKAAAAARDQAIPPEQLTAIKAQMLDRLIQIQLLAQKATAADKAEGQKKTDEQLKAYVEQAGSQTNFDAHLQAAGMSESELRSKISQEITAMVTLQRELGISISDAEARAYYTNHPADFEVPEKVHVRHILLFTIDPTTHAPLPADQQAAKRKQIEDILKRARAGEDFATLAKEYSEDPGSKDDGGELPAFARGQMVPEFEAAAFSLTNNQISDVVTTQYGYHIIQLLDKIPAKTLTLTDKLPLSDMTVADYIKEKLAQQKMATVAPPYLVKLTQSADVQILDPDLKALIDAQTNAPVAPPAQ